ncbi:hypothetical protein OF83DRAFT_656818 [Amylostereum chailletii]|nr:hypothetical protein OF83DRAFT_656818 [Amylostereum chailletii]
MCQCLRGVSYLQLDHPKHSMANVDRGYTILLSHLHKPTSTLPLTSLQSLITHFLAHTPTPTPLSATIISSPLFRPFSHAKLTALTTAFRHAIHVKLKILEDESTGLFTRSLKARMAEWAQGVVKGFGGGQGVIRLVGAGGVLLGLEDLKEKLGTHGGSGGVRGRTEDEVVIALAEIMDVYGGRKDGDWEKEFHPETEHGEADVLSLSLLHAAQFLHQVSSERLTVLPLAVLSSHFLSTIETVFLHGNFLSSLPSSCTTDSQHKLCLTTRPKTAARPSFPYEDTGVYQQASPLSISLRTVTSSTLFASVASLARMTAKIIPLLVDSRPQDGWPSMQEVLQRLERMAALVERDWSQSALANVDNEDAIAPESRELATTLWTVLKTFLFTAVMISLSPLTTALYNRPPPVLRGNLTGVAVGPVTPSTLALTTLNILSHLSFVISKFGGVTATAETGFSELKKVFFTALDLLSADVQASDIFARSISVKDTLAASSTSTSSPANTPFYRSTRSFQLACVEQLVPVLNLETIEAHISPLCLPHLHDAEHREIFESAHSVVLAIFASHAQKQPEMAPAIKSGQEPRFTEKIVPFYARCLLENSADDKLNTAQLRLAYAALVGSASASSPALAQYCMAELHTAVSSIITEEEAQRRHRLHLTLVSTLSALPIALLPSTLDMILAAISSLSDDEERMELVEAVFTEILERVGDREKEYTMRWWVDHEATFSGTVHLSKAKGKGKEKPNDIVASSRL